MARRVFKCTMGVQDDNEDTYRRNAVSISVGEQRLAHYQNLMAKYYNSRVKQRDFQVGDFILRKVTGTTRDPFQGKLGPNWEGPYRIASWQRKGTYHLETLDGQKLHHPWNTKHLKKYY